MTELLPLIVCSFTLNLLLQRPRFSAIPQMMVELPSCTEKLLMVRHYRKNSKNWDTGNNYHNCPTIGTVGFYSAVLCSKDADRTTNREDPDQTAP